MFSFTHTLFFSEYTPLYPPAARRQLPMCGERAVWEQAPVALTGGLLFHSVFPPCKNLPFHVTTARGQLPACGERTVWVQAPVAVAGQPPSSFQVHPHVGCALRQCAVLQRMQRTREYCSGRGDTPANSRSALAECDMHYGRGRDACCDRVPWRAATAAALIRGCDACLGHMATGAHPAIAGGGAGAACGACRTRRRLHGAHAAAGGLWFVRSCCRADNGILHEICRWRSAPHRRPLHGAHIQQQVWVVQELYCAVLNDKLNRKCWRSVPPAPTHTWRPPCSRHQAFWASTPRFE